MFWNKDNFSINYIHRFKRKEFKWKKVFSKENLKDNKTRKAIANVPKDEKWGK